MTTVFFHALLWKKQPPEACFNLFLVLLLSPDSVADYVLTAVHKKPRHLFNFTMHNKECTKQVFSEQ
jgi:hypothetical protein